MLSALAQGLANTDRVAIVRWVKRGSSPPKIYAMYPYINKQDGIYGFHAIQLPFSDDLRRPALGSLDKAGKAPSDEQLDLARSIVEAASLVDGCGNLLLESRAMPNPVIQNFHQTIVDKVRSLSPVTCSLPQVDRRGTGLHILLFLYWSAVKTAPSLDGALSDCKFADYVACAMFTPPRYKPRRVCQRVPQRSLALIIIFIEVLLHAHGLAFSMAN